MYTLPKQSVLMLYVEVIVRIEYFGRKKNIKNTINITIKTLSITIAAALFIINDKPREINKQLNITALLEHLLIRKTNL